MTFVPCCKCGNISVMAPLQRIMKVFTKLNPTSNLNENIQKQTPDPSTSSNGCNDESTEPLLSLLLKPKSIFIKEINRIQLSKMLTDLTTETPIHYLNQNSHSHFHPSPAQDSISLNEQAIDPSSSTTESPRPLKTNRSSSDLIHEKYHHHGIPSVVINSIFLKCKKCNTIFVINMTKKNTYLSKLTFHQPQSHQPEQHISFSEPNSPENDQNNIRILTDSSIESTSKNIQNNMDIQITSNQNQHHQVSLAAHQKSQASNYTLNLIRPSPMSKCPQFRELISTYVPQFISPLIYGTEGLSKDCQNSTTGSHLIRSKSQSNRPTSSFMATSYKPPNPVPCLQSEDTADDMFEMKLLHNRCTHGSDKDNFFGTDWPDTDFEYMFSSKEHSPPEMGFTSFL